MQTFLPFNDLKLSVKCLDNKRLCKQIVEAFQIITFRVPTINHPAVLMWHTYEKCLIQYTIYCCEEYTNRYDKIHSIYEFLCSEYNIYEYTLIDNFEYPSWFNSQILFLSHKINLLRKDFDWYSKYFEYNLLDEYSEGYYWPLCKGNVSKMHTENWKNYNLKRIF